MLGSPVVSRSCFGILNGFEISNSFGIFLLCWDPQWVEIFNGFRIFLLRWDSQWVWDSVVMLGYPVDSRSLTVSGAFCFGETSSNMSNSAALNSEQREEIFGITEPRTGHKGEKGRKNPDAANPQNNRIREHSSQLLLLQPRSLTCPGPPVPRPCGRHSRV